MNSMRILSCSADLFRPAQDCKGELFPVLRVREVYRRTVNLEEQGSGKRWSIVVSEEDFGPRTVLVDSLSPLEEGETITLLLEGVPAGYDPSLPAGKINSRWIPLISEWADFLEGDLELLASPVRRRAFAELLGLGPGSTPAGDDFLTGYVSGSLWFGLFPLPSLDPLHTSWLSGGILKDALNGLLWKRSRDVLAASVSDKTSALPEAAGRILGWGHSSGRAWLAGFASAVSEMAEQRKGG